MRRSALSFAGTWMCRRKNAPGSGEPAQRGHASRVCLTSHAAVGKALLLVNFSFAQEKKGSSAAERLVKVTRELKVHESFFFFSASQALSSAFRARCWTLREIYLVFLFPVLGLPM
jgi:hypothetical protein